MKKVMINELQRGLYFCNGKFVKLLRPGKYRTFGDRRIEVLALDQPIASASCSLNTLLCHPEIAKETVVAEVGDQQLALHFVDGKFAEVLRKGKYAFWTAQHSHEFRMVDTADPVVGGEVPLYIFETLEPWFYTRFEVGEHQKGCLFIDQKFAKVLDCGTYYFWKTEKQVDVRCVDMHLTQMDIRGQEILTRDKVSLRINFYINYRITDCVKVLTEIDNYIEQLHVAAQLVLREYVGRYKLDEILENKAEISQFVTEQLREKAAALFVAIVDGGVKDIILPGEIRDIMNTVLVAEKRAQANVITRREEVASTRSLLNTAKLMEENETLYRLKELEYIERICDNVGNINLNGSGDLLVQLGEILRGRSS